MTLDDMGAEVAVGALAVAGVADGGRQVKHDGDRDSVVTVRELEQRLAGAFLDIGGVDDGEFATAQADGGDVMEGIEGVGVGVEDGFVVGDEAAEVI